MNSTRKYNCFLAAVVTHVFGLPAGKVNKILAYAQKVFLVCLTETSNLLLKSRLQKSLDFSLGLLHLLKYLSCLHILLFPRFLQHCRQVELKLESLLVSNISLNILGDSHQGHWQSAESLAQHLCAHNLAVFGCCHAGN